MKINGTIILCGATATYTQWKEKAGVSTIGLMISKRLKMKGILYFYDKGKLLESFMEMVQVKLDFHDTLV